MRFLQGAESGRAALRCSLCLAWARPAPGAALLGQHARAISNRPPRRYRGCSGLASQLVDKWCAGPQPIDNVVSFRRPEDFKDYVVESELEGDSGRSWKMM